MKMTFFGKFYTVAFYRILIVKKIYKWVAMGGLHDFDEHEI